MAKSSSIFTAELVAPAISESFVKLSPTTLYKNPVMFVTGIVAALSTLLWIKGMADGVGNAAFQGQLVFWLCLS